MNSTKDALTMGFDSSTYCELKNWNLTFPYEFRMDSTVDNCRLLRQNNTIGMRFDPEQESSVYVSMGVLIPSSDLLPIVAIVLITAL
jgi:hypothetical protein